MNKDFDKIFKSKLENHLSEVPNGIWDEIEKAIEPKKEKNNYFLPFIICIGLIGGVIGLMLLPSLNTNSSAKVISEVSNTVENSVATETIKTNIIEETAKEKIETENLLEVSKAQSNEHLNERIINQKLRVGSNASVASASEINAHSSPNTNITSNHLKQQNQSSKKLYFFDVVDSKTIVKEANGSNEEFNVLNRNSANSRENESNQDAATSGLRSKYLRTKNLMSIRHNDLILSELSPLPLSVLVEDREETTKLDLNFNRPAATDCPSWVREKLGLYLEAYYAPEYALRSITAKSPDSLTIANQQARNNSENGLLSYSLGVRALFLTPSGISFKLGLNYSQINERFTWQDPESQQEVTVVDIDPVSGDTLAIDTYTQFGSEKIEIINRYKSFDLPLLVGFEKYRGKKLSYSMNAGIYLNLISEQRGMFFDPNGNRTWFTSDNSPGNYNAYKNSLGISFFASAGLMYHWVEGIDFFVEPSVRFYSQSFTLNNYPLNQKYIAVGLHTGIRYRF